MERKNNNQTATVRPKRGRIRIRRCTAEGPDYANLRPGSVHRVVSCPEGRSPHGGVWVMGAEGQPVKVLYEEIAEIMVESEPAAPAAGKEAGL